ncbi:23S rRNA (cytidine(2498)-2'-O)-methyltransferase RlmM [Gayadomonas joobiniege]|uniref:23S rRNA (cytidine(2498)-2'-O)-methyltransferase RlmM n=1 Tax=Gayadomonas joobiniege TaxID=1234606 RepID=UPI000364E33B|nr:23S rRNA (cytidine(2498)-2'-O)-methyltransferase RlmM [Gayadomonas joobiniege]
MAEYLLYCRAGFESECAGEIQARAAEHQLFGYCKAEKNSGLVEFICDADSSAAVFNHISLDSLIFTRQWFSITARLFDLDEGDRINPILVALQGNQYAQLSLDYADTNEGKHVSGFLKKFSRPLNQTLKSKAVLTQNAKQSLHLFFLNSNNLLLGWNPNQNRSEWHLGIKRLRFPSSAPSRSTLKLEEAFHYFIPKDEWAERLTSGLNAVDLGAAPGGWTWQLVQRGMMVTAIDNGPMNQALMDSGQVKHFREDGFKYRPFKKNVYWLVCDMVEKPFKVANLMADWAIDGYCREAIFNLKLPMKQRYTHLNEVLEAIEVRLYESGLRYELKAKHLYHDREEVTCHLRVF